MFFLFFFALSLYQQSVSSQSSKQNSFSNAFQVISIQPMQEKPSLHSSMMSVLKEVESTSHMCGHGGIHLLTPTFFENMEQEFQSWMKEDYSTYPQ